MLYVKKSLVSILLLVFFIFSAYAQKKLEEITITENYSKVPLIHILNTIEKESGVKFIYLEKDLQNIIVTTQLKNDPLSFALDILLDNTHLNHYLRDEKSMVIYYDKSKVVKRTERYTIRGEIADHFGNTLQGVEVYMAEFDKKVYSDEKGFYEITNVPKGKFYLKFKRPGYYFFSEIYKITGDVELNIKLTQASKLAVNDATSEISETAQISLLDKKVKLEKHSGSLKQILDEISVKGEFPFSYIDNDVALDKQTIVRDTIQTVKGILDGIFQNSRIEYIEWENKIVLKARKTNSKKFTISGIVKEKLTGESLPGVTVSVKGTQIGTITNAYGFYSLTIPEWDYTIVYSYIGYKTIKKEVSLSKNIKINVELEETVSELNEVVITSEMAEKHLETPQMSSARLDIKTLKRMPAFMGEVDLIRSIQMMPGVTTVGEGSTGFNVRGGGIDQNLILLDEAQVYNSSHLLGFFSVFNADAIKESKLYKGGIPPMYGGRLSSVLDISQKEGDNKKMGGTGGIGLISSRLALEGPIVKNKASFIVAGRRSYADQIFKNGYLSTRLHFPNDIEAYFYDLNAKINYKVNEKNRLFLSGYYGKDNYRFGKDMLFNWGNTTGTFRWNHIFNEKMFSNFTFVYSNYDYGQGEPSGFYAYTGRTGIINYNIKSDFIYYLNENHKVDFGFNSILYQIEPGRAKPLTDSSSFNSINIVDDYSLESAVYINDEFKFNSRITVNYGLRYSIFNNVGPGRYFAFAPNEPRSLESFQDTVKYTDGEIVNSYHGFEPRFSAKIEINKNNALKLSYSRMRQYIHLVSNTTGATPLDIWKTSNKNIKPQIADQFAIGYFTTLRENTLEFSAEVYYKNFQNLVDYKNGADLIVNEMIDADILQGKGRAYGIEFLINKKVGRLTGWTSYTYSRTERQIKTPLLRDQINFGRWYPADYDQPNKINVVALYQLSKRISLSSNFTYNTGRPTTYPEAQYVYRGRIIPHYSSRNQQRIPDYHRLDFSATLEGRGNKWWKGSWTLSFYNIYGRKNAYSVFFRQKEGTQNTETVKLSIIGSIIPSLSYNFKF
ncbi:MAG TPA: carboxypeptidase-like regulatory domain-containing protein [Cytophagales bacterium]|nr:carboxypeptidase-like regulatory domain-containing protein [Cytophagales bacterium]